MNGLSISDNLYVKVQVRWAVKEMQIIEALPIRTPYLAGKQALV